MTTRIVPIVFVWDGEVMVPLPRFDKQCNIQYVVGEEYPLMILEARSRSSHNHYFAALAEAFDNLPEWIANEYQNPEHLRAIALINTGWSTERKFVCDTPEHAMNLCGYLTQDKPFSIVRVKENVIQIFDAVSQSAAAMGKDSFQKSKSDVLDWCAALIGTPRAQLVKFAGYHFPRLKERDHARR